MDEKQQLKDEMANKVLEANVKSKSRVSRPQKPTPQKAIKEKRPPYTFKDGAVYTGEWLGNVPEGYGVAIWSSG